MTNGMEEQRKVPAETKPQGSQIKVYVNINGDTRIIKAFYMNRRADNAFAVNISCVPHPFDLRLSHK